MILIPFFTFLIFFIYYQIKNKWSFGIISLLISTYLLTSFLGAILYYSNILIAVFAISFISMFYFSALVFLTLIGFSPYKDYKIKSIKINNLNLLRQLEVFLLYSSILSIIFFTPFAFKSFQGDIYENRINIKENIALLGKFGIINSFASLFANLFMLTQMFFFLNLIPINGIIRKRKSIIMLIASLSYIVYILAYVGRDGVVFWIMSFIFQYLFFKKFIDSEIKKTIKKNIFVFAIILTIPFMLISIARFSNSPLGLYLEIVNYIGQQLINFNDQFAITAPLQMGNSNFPEFASFFRAIGFHIPMRTESNELFSYYLDYGVMPWTFSTFIGSFKSDFGRLGTFIFVAFLFFIIHRLTKRSIQYNSFPISNFILFILLFQTVYFGVFYFRLYSANFYIITMVLIYLIFKIRIKNKIPIFLYKI